MACLPSAAVIGVFVAVNIMLPAIGHEHQLPYQTCIADHAGGVLSCQEDDLFGWQADATCNPCYAEYEEMISFQGTQQVVQFITSCYLCVILGNNRSKLQLALGMQDAGIVNYILYFPLVFPFLGPCTQCQEARAVEHRWLANAQQPLVAGELYQSLIYQSRGMYVNLNLPLVAGIQAPMQPVAVAGMYGQAPQ